MRAFTYKIVFLYDQRLINGSSLDIVNKNIPLSSFTNSLSDPGKQQARMIFS